MVRRISVFLLVIIISVVLLTMLFNITFTGQWILPQGFAIGPLFIRFYGICLAVATVVGFYFALRRAPLFNIASEEAEDLLFKLIIGGFIGARLYHILSSFGFYRTHPLDIVKVWNGGLSIYGVILAGIAITFWHAWKKHHSGSDFFRFADWLAPSLLLGQIIGRLGNFFNYELYGYPTNLPWKMFVPLGFRHPQFISSSYYHPLFLYEMLWNALALGIIIRIQKKYNPEAGYGKLFFLYLLLYNIGRFFLEYLRIDSVFVGAVRVNAIVSLLLAVIAFGGLYWRNKHVSIP